MSFFFFRKFFYTRHFLLIVYSFNSLTIHTGEIFGMTSSINKNWPEITLTIRNVHLNFLKRFIFIFLDGLWFFACHNHIFYLSFIFIFHTKRMLWTHISNFFTLFILVGNSVHWLVITKLACVLELFFLVFIFPLIFFTFWIKRIRRC